MQRIIIRIGELSVEAELNDSECARAERTGNPPVREKRTILNKVDGPCNWDL